MYLLVQNGAVARYPYSFEELRRDNPDTSFPAQPTLASLAEWGVFPVVQTQPPDAHPLTQTVVEDTPIQVDGVWVQVWELRAASAQEIAKRQESIRARITDQVQRRLDEFAMTRGYDGIVSACSYATSQHPKYGPEGRYCVTTREDTWDVLFQIEADVMAGLRPIPLSYDEIEPELPVLVWPV